ncbi:hypothetical protein ID866_7500 [Astraeus odoratus]|nr:hypothetical protein ID866_7500 [Astraeus odoratus]
MLLPLRTYTLPVLLSLVAVTGAYTQAFFGLNKQAPIDHSQYAFYSSKTQDVATFPVAYDRNTFTPIGHLDALSSETFTVLKHPAFPRQTVRIKKVDPNVFKCDNTVNTYAGYIDITGDKHMFFYFFESRNDPKTDDVIFWTSGGPGCSSSLAVFFEQGPCQIRDADGPYFNKYSWNANANMFFVDQPVGVGFSHADHNVTVSTTEEAGKDLAAFVAIFFEHFTDFRGRAFHMSGESYAGRYLPVFASQVYDQNAKLVEAGITPINLKSVMIGNGLTDWFSMELTYVDMLCTNASVVVSTCAPYCDRWTKAACINNFDYFGCEAATDFCNKELVNPFDATGMNPYDLSKKCEDPENLCYPATKYTKRYLDKPTIREALNVDSSVSEFSSCSNDVYNAFDNALDEYHPTYSHVAELLDRGVRVLIYVGTYDLVCNWIGNEQWTLEMPWTGQAQFVAQPLREWEVDGEVVGQTRNASGFTYATVYKSGHLVPHDKPAVAQEMVKKWLAEEPL